MAQSAKAVEYTDCISEYPEYDTKLSDGEVPVMLGPSGMQSTPLLTSLLDQHWPGVVSPERFLSMGQIELNCVLMLSRIS